MVAALGVRVLFTLPRNLSKISYLATVTSKDIRLTFISMTMPNSTQNNLSRHEGGRDPLDTELKTFVDTMFDWQLQRSTTLADTKLKTSLKEGALAFSVGNWKGALRSLEYSQRIAPSHRGITLLMGYVRLYVGIPAATEPFEHILASESNREAWFGLAAARLQAKDLERAAGDIQEGLSRHSPPREPWMRKLAATIATKANALGWCSLTPEGDLLLGGRAAVRDKQSADFRKRNTL